MSAGHGWVDVRRLEELAAGSTSLHRLDALAKLLVSFGFTVAVASFPPAAVTRLVPYLAFPVVCVAVGGIPLRDLLPRVALVLPLAVVLGIASPVFDRAPALQIGDLVVTRGWLGLIGIVFRVLLIAAAGVCLTALTGFDAVCAALGRVGLPQVLLVQLRLMFRHLSTVAEEVGHTLLAYRLRAVGATGRLPRGVHPRLWGSLAGSLLLRSLDRAERVQTAMLCRAGGRVRLDRGTPRGSNGIGFAAFWLGYCTLCRLVDFPALLGSVAMAVLR